MTRKAKVNVAASVRARLLKVSKERFVLKGAMLFAARVGVRYRPTRDLDLLGLGEAPIGSRIVAAAYDKDAQKLRQQRRVRYRAISDRIGQVLGKGLPRGLRSISERILQLD